MNIATQLGNCCFCDATIPHASRFGACPACLRRLADEAKARERASPAGRCVVCRKPTPAGTFYCGDCRKKYE